MSPFRVLWRTFVDQFFTSESVTSDLHLHQSIVWVLVFLLVPGAFLLIMLLPEFEGAVIQARLGLAPPTYVDDLLAWIAFSLTTYSMVTVGFITVLAWDALTFDRRDAMVLGSLPLPGRTVLSAKLAALAAFLAVGALSIGGLNSLAFALTTSDQLGAIVFVRHFESMLVATLGAAVFIFSAIVAIRGCVMLAGRSSLAAACGPPLQFVFIVATLCLVVLSPAVWEIPFVTATFTDWMPSAWFVGVFEQLRGSPRAFDPGFPFMIHARRALIGTSIAVAGALLVSLAEFSRQMRAALAPAASSGLLGGAFASRTLARLVLGRNQSARARADFILLTLARNRALQASIAMNAAVGATLVITALARNSQSLAALARPRTAVLWIPLVMAYWITVGLRAAFFKPSELPAAWSFRASGPDGGRHWLAVRAAMVGFVIPRVMILSALLMPVLGLATALWNALLVCALVILLIDASALTVHHMPFTRAYEPGHARLRTRWFWYTAGLFLFAYFPARLELLFLHQPSDWLTALAGLFISLAVMEVIGRRAAAGSSVEADDEAGEGDLSITVLDIAGVMR